MHPGQVLGASLPLLSPPLDVPTFAARCLYVRNDARDPSSERWNCGRESFPVYIHKFQIKGTEQVREKFRPEVALVRQKILS